ncbi:MAG TPA: tetratricopeptide repeat protein, partial [Candidatus Krumholzibacteria bacterium]|nr:tetratricopeptide repeat protein [Candidatus Krumholzibacteria bacterium]
MSRNRFASWTITLLVTLVLSGCASSIKSPRLNAGLSQDEAREASKEYEQLLAASAAGQNSQARDLAYAILDRYPGFEHEDHVLLLGARAADELGDDRTARVLLDSLLQHHPASLYRPDAWWLTAQIHDRKLQWREAALAYVHYLDQPG